MLRVQATAKSGIQGDKVFLSFIGEDRKRYKILMPPAAAVGAVVSILGAVRDLPEGDALTQAQWISVIETVFKCLGA